MIDDDDDDVCIISYLRIGFAVWKIGDLDLDEMKETHMGEILNMINTRN